MKFITSSKVRLLFPIASISIFRLDSSRLASRALYSVSIVVFS